MQIRGYEATSDEKALIGLAEALADFDLLQRINGTDFKKKQREWLKEELRQGDRDQHLLVLVEKEKIIGFIQLTEEEDWLTGAKQGYVSRICVSDTARGRGLGKKLMGLAEDWARQQGYAGLGLNVFCSNEHAVAFYRSLGFEMETMKMRKEL